MEEPCRVEYWSISFEFEARIKVVTETFIIFIFLERLYVYLYVGLSTFVFAALYLVNVFLLSHVTSKPSSWIYDFISSSRNQGSFLCFINKASIIWKDDTYEYEKCNYFRDITVLM